MGTSDDGTIIYDGKGNAKLGHALMAANTKGKAARKRPPMQKTPKITPS